VRIQTGADYGATTRKRNNKMTENKASIDMEINFVDRFNAMPEFRTVVNESLGGTDYISASKFPRDYVSDEWRDLTGKRHREVPKSDFYLETIDGQTIGTSFKNGQGRLTSANYNETRAIFETVLQHNLGKYANEAQLHKDVHALFALWEPYRVAIPTKEIDNDMTITLAIAIRHDKAECSNRKSMDKIFAYIDQATKVLHPLLIQAREDHREYLLDVLIEASTGEYKFGKDSLSCAENFIQCKGGQLGIIDIATTTTNSAYRAYCEKVLDSGKFNIRMKTGGTGKSIWIRFL
jgi:hypothetical protein